MEKEKEYSNYNQCISIIDRKNIFITGVKKVDSFDDEEFLIETSMGYLAIKGEDLELIKLDTLQGSISIKGLIKSMDYFEENSKKESNNSFINRLCK